VIVAVIDFPAFFGNKDASEVVYLPRGRNFGR